MVIGDVAGHGAPAAAKAAGLRFAWRTIVQIDPSPRAVLEVMNNQIGSTEERIAGRFASLLHILIAPDGSCEMAPAGHPAPILVTTDSSEQIEIDEPGPPIGIFDDAEWPLVSFQLPESATLVLFTDGLIEARRDGALFGADGACAVLENERGAAIQERVVRLIDAARRFDSANLRDDVVVMAIDRPRVL